MQAELMSAIDLALFCSLLDHRNRRFSRRSRVPAAGRRRPVALGPETKSVPEKEKLETKRGTVLRAESKRAEQRARLPLPFLARIRECESRDRDAVCSLGAIQCSTTASLFV